MRLQSLALALPLAIVVAATAANPAHAQELGLAVGTAAPAAAVQTLDGKPANLSQWIGKTPVVMEFWATWCPNCKELEPAMVAAARKHGDRVKFVAVAVSVNQSPERVRRYQARYKVPMTFVYDHDGNATDVYEVPATSYVVVLDRAGKVVYTGLGGKQDLEAAIARATAQ
ncbi:MAG: TlpA family protein disulfide reductase [Gemmatimonadaceae bacterium]